MKLNLKNARRLDTEIQAALQEILMQGRAVQSIEVSYHDDLEFKLRAAQAKVMLALDKHNRLSKIRFDIRRVIEMINEESGINALMNTEAQLREEASLLDMMLQYYSRTDCALTDERKTNASRKLHQLKALSSSPNGSIEDSINVSNVLDPVQVADLTARARAIRTQLNEIKDSCSFKNSDPKYSVIIDDVDVDFLKSVNLI